MGAIAPIQSKHHNSGHNKLELFSLYTRHMWSV